MIAAAVVVVGLWMLGLWTAASNELGRSPMSQERSSGLGID